MEKEIVHKAIKSLKKTNGITARWKPSRGTLDGVLTVKINNINIEFTAEIKREPRKYQLEHILNLHNTYNNFILIAEHLFPSVKKQLRKAGVAYLESNGNAFFSKEHIFYLVDTNKKEKPVKGNTNRAFTKTGLKVLFHLLTEKDLINKKQREIAEITQLSLGSIPQVINGLKQRGYLIALNKRRYTWNNKEKLIEEWINAYANHLRPTLIKGHFRILENWKTLIFRNNHTVWGGEPAADALTNYLRPEDYLIYTRETNVDLIKHYKLMPDENGELKVLEMFWNNTNHHTAPPLLIYAELMLSRNRRNMKTADMIYEQFIKPNL